MEPFVPAAHDALGLVTEHGLNILDVFFRDDVPEPEVFDVIRRNHDLHAAEWHLENEILFVLPENFAGLDGGDDARAMHRVEHFVTNLQVDTPPYFIVQRSAMFIITRKWRFLKRKYCITVLYVCQAPLCGCTPVRERTT